MRKEQAVQRAIVSEVVEHVRLKCAEQAQLIERVYEMQSGLVQALPAKLERAQKRCGGLEKKLRHAEQTAHEERTRPCAHSRCQSS